MIFSLLTIGHCLLVGPQFLNDLSKTTVQRFEPNLMEMLLDPGGFKFMKFMLITLVECHFNRKVPKAYSGNIGVMVKGRLGRSVSSPFICSKVSIFPTLFLLYEFTQISHDGGKGLLNLGQVGRGHMYSSVSALSFTFSLILLYFFFSSLVYLLAHLSLSLPSWKHTYIILTPFNSTFIW